MNGDEKNIACIFTIDNRDLVSLPEICSTQNGDKEIRLGVEKTTDCILIYNARQLVRDAAHFQSNKEVIAITNCHFVSAGQRKNFVSRVFSKTDAILLKH